MKTEWHRYNLKRRVAQLAPVSNNVFQVKLAHTKERVKLDDFGFVVEDSKGKKNNSNKKKTRYNQLLNRGRGNFNTNIENRDISPAVSEISTFSLGTLRSQSEYGYDSDDLKSEVSTRRDFESDYYTEEDYHSDENITEDGEAFEYEPCEPLNLNDCFYCGTKFNSLDDNISHMLGNHGLYIPEIKYLSDKEGLIRLLSDTVVVDKVCLKCGFESKKLIGIRQHIIAKGHACIPYESKEERNVFKKFYTFETDMDNGDGDEMNEEDREEDEDEDEDEDEEYTIATVDSTGVELALPNGFKLGHRSMSKYYRQNFPRSDRRMSEGEKTVSVLNNENDKLLKLQESVRQKAEVKKLSVINSKITNRQLSKNSLKYLNNLEHYQNQKFG